MTKTIKKCAFFILCAILIMSSIPVYVFADETYSETDEYYSSLIEAGFPEDYSIKLLKIHEAHPNWTFTPLFVTEISRKMNKPQEYSWDLVLQYENRENPKRNLVSRSDTYKAYRHETNTELYDSGWYQASDSAVEFFLDPRNFLNEKDIFQFQDLCYIPGTVTVEAVQSALVGTFMENGKLSNGKTYAEYFLELGETVGVDPIHLAARVRQEQGVSGGPQITGLCGDRLAYYYENKIQVDENGHQVLTPSSGYTISGLKEYNGLYNYFNIGAAGTGYFQIFIGAMNEAKTGTPEMSKEWGGSPSWNTDWKALYGGAFKLYTKYVSDYQNTLYLQKFNVDARSKRNFWGQYMQNLFGAFSEARTMYYSLASTDCLELPFNFQIPVYEGMPNEASSDPADGNCSFTRPADSFILPISGIKEPVVSECEVNEFVDTTITESISKGNTFNLCGWSVNTVGTTEFEYSIDFGDWKRVTATKDTSLAGKFDASYRPTTSRNGVNSYSIEIDTSDMEEGLHTIRVRTVLNTQSSTACIYYISSVVNFTVEKEEETTIEETTLEKSTIEETTVNETFTEETTVKETENTTEEITSNISETKTGCKSVFVLSPVIPFICFVFLKKKQNHNS